MIRQVFKNRSPSPNVDAKASGVFRLRCFDPKLNKVIWEVPLKNGATTAGLNHVLNVTFGGSTQATTWYGGLIDNDAYSAVAAGDTMSSHGGWNENTSYDESNRVAWNPSAAAGGSMSNGTNMVFTASTDLTIRGVFLATGSTKGTTSGTLYSTAVEGSGRAVNDGQQLQVTYTLSYTPS